jgi:hypothetical protein
MLYHTMDKQEYGFKLPSMICHNKLDAAFGDYSQPLAEKYVGCPNGSPQEGHGHWVSVINLVLN